MITRLLLDVDRLLKKAKNNLEWRKRVAIPDNTWDALMEAHRAITVLSTELHVESGRLMAGVPVKKDQPPLNPKAMSWATKLDRAEMALTRVTFGLRREHPIPEEQHAAEMAELEKDIVRALH